MKIVIIDDEKNARDSLRSMLQMMLGDIEAIAEADGVTSGKAAIRKYHPDLVFLDIRMKDGTGFDMLRQLEDRNFALVFLTAHEDHALEAFRYAATDYLLKPLDPEALEEAVEKARKQQNPNPGLVDALLENMRNLNSSRKKLALKTTNSIYFVNSDDIIRCESIDNYTRFFLKAQKPLIIARPLKFYEEMLEPLGFLRIHQSHLINLSRIQRIERQGGLSVVMEDDSEVPVAVRKKELLINKLTAL